LALGGYFFLPLVMLRYAKKSPTMPMITRVYWNKSEKVTTNTPPFKKSQGEQKGLRPPVCYGLDICQRKRRLAVAVSVVPPLFYHIPHNLTSRLQAKIKEGVPLCGAPFQFAEKVFSTS